VREMWEGFGEANKGVGKSGTKVFSGQIGIYGGQLRYFSLFKAH
jgi:hypothetical protein